ncbi:Zinc knuckle [Gracilaria domingensis]|nr:Zinc knuckle [Gracilaria domingensis]
MKLDNERDPYGGVQKPTASTNYANARYSTPNGRPNVRRGPPYRNTSTRSNFGRPTGPGKCFYCQKPGHIKRNCPFRKRGKRIYDTLFAAANQSNPTGECDGTNHESIMSILQAAIAHEDRAHDDDTFDLNNPLAATLLCESDHAHDQFASHEGYDEEDNDITDEGHIHHTGFLYDFASDYANDVLKNDDVPPFEAET